MHATQSAVRAGNERGGGKLSKADPKGFGPQIRLVVYITGEGTSEDTAHRTVEEARAQLKEALEVLGYGLTAGE